MPASLTSRRSPTGRYPPATPRPSMTCPTTSRYVFLTFPAAATTNVNERPRARWPRGHPPPALPLGTDTQRDRTTRVVLRERRIAELEVLAQFRAEQIGRIGGELELRLPIEQLR